MPARKSCYLGMALAALGVLLLFAGSASAYVAPAAGLALTGHARSLGLWLAAALAAVLLWPFYAILRWFRAARQG